MIDKTPGLKPGSVPTKPAFAGRAAGAPAPARRLQAPREAMSLGRILLLGLALSSPFAAGCARSRASERPAATAAAFSPEGRWRSSMLSGMVMTAHLRPDGALEMIDPRGHSHLFPRIAPDQWKARISRQAIGSLHPEGEHLVFRVEAAPEASKPLAQKGGLTIVHQVKPIEDRMTRVPETAPGH